MAVIPLNIVYNLTWLASLSTSLSNISYNIIVRGLGVDDYVIITQTLAHRPDVTSVGSVSVERNASDILDDPSSANTGDYAFVYDTTLLYIVKGDSVDETIAVTTSQCLIPGCAPPPPTTQRPLTPLGRPENGTVLWSEPSTWPNNQVPVEGQDVTLNGSSMYVILDVMNISLGLLAIRDGAVLDVSDEMDHTIELDLMIIDGGAFVAGYEEQPFAHKLTILLAGEISTPEYIQGPFAPVVGAKAIGVFGDLILNAVTSTVSWTLLLETAHNGSDLIVLTDSVDWVQGQLIVITSTSYDAYQTEVFEIAEVSSDGRTLQLNRTLMYTHLGATAAHYSIRAEVGLLSRNIKIANRDAETSHAQAFGFRVLVASDNLGAVGSVQLHGVEFSGGGQLGHTEAFDPRFALALVGLGDGVRPSFISSCSFHDSYNSAIGVFGANELIIAENVVYSTVGSSVVVSGERHFVSRNLASLAQYPGSYRGRNDPVDPTWRANYELIDAVDLIFIFNRAAGGDKACFHMHGEHCSYENSSSVISDNVGHSAVSGVHLGYEDQRPSDCSVFRRFEIYSCVQYGLFSYSPSSIVVRDSVFIGNMVGVYVSVMGPASRNNRVGNKFVLIENTVIVSANSSSRCEDEKVVPTIAIHPATPAGIHTPSGGHVGVVIPSFVSGRGHFPPFNWHTIISYPAINGTSVLRNVTFGNFEQNCGHRDAALMTNRFSEDANHPLILEQITHTTDTGGQVDESSKVYIHKPNIGSINPSDCVDMDCDGFKEMVIKDRDGSFTGANAPRTLVTRAEFEWDGDARRGLGDYRIPRTLLTDDRGGMLDPRELFRQRGIIRGVDVGDNSSCTYISDWQIYKCSDLTHNMFVIESLDADTESRRLSPIGLATNGYINLLNGPMDNGWCGGYTCQERISTFYAIVASGYLYTIALTSTNPQDMALHLLHCDSDSDPGIIVAIIYTGPQRLDVYAVEENEVERYIVPQNATVTDDGDLQYAVPDPNGPDDQFVPTFQDQHGANHYDSTTKRLYIRIGCGRTVRIYTVPRIVLNFDLTVTVDSFFDESMLIGNIAALLGIPENKIRMVEVTSEAGAGRRRRKRDSPDGTVLLFFVIEISEVPVESGAGENEEEEDETSSDETSSDETFSEDDTLTYERLVTLSDDFALIVQLSSDDLLVGLSGVTIASVVLIEPTAPPVDPTNSVLATPETGGPQPGDNGTESILTYYQIQLLNEELEANLSASDNFVLTVPALLIIQQIVPDGTIEGISLTSELAPIVAMLDTSGGLATTLGIVIPWRLTAHISYGPDDGFLAQATANFSQGLAVFEGLTFSHPGAYALYFTMSYPEAASIFTVESSTVIEVEARDLALRITQQPQDGNMLFALDPYPTVELVDLDDSDRRVANHTWRGTDWYVVALEESTGEQIACEPLVGGVATFTAILIHTPGEYQLHFEAFENACDEENLNFGSTLSDVFEIKTQLFTRVIYTYDLDYSIVRERLQEFNNFFVGRFQEEYPGLEGFNITTTEGSIVVGLFVTSEDEENLRMLVRDITQGSTFSFMFDGTLFEPSGVTRDPNYPLEQSSSTHGSALVYVLSTLLPIAFLAGIILSAVVAYVMYKKKSEYKINAVLVSG